MERFAASARQGFDSDKFGRSGVWLNRATELSQRIRCQFATATRQGFDSNCRDRCWDGIVAWGSSRLRGWLLRITGTVTPAVGMPIWRRLRSRSAWCGSPTDGEDGFRLGSDGIERVEPLLAGLRLRRAAGARREPCIRRCPARSIQAGCGRGRARLGACSRRAPIAARAAREVWRSRALVLLGRGGRADTGSRARAAPRGRLAGLQAEIERAPPPATRRRPQAAHARYIELGTTFMRRFVLVEDGRAGTAG